MYVFGLYVFWAFPFSFLYFYKYFLTKNIILYMNKLFMLGVNLLAYRK